MAPNKFYQRTLLQSMGAFVLGLISACKTDGCETGRFGHVHGICRQTIDSPVAPVPLHKQVNIADVHFTQGLN